MPEWQERITRDTHPEIVGEHIARYRFAAPVVTKADVWCDFGCGSGVAAHDGLGSAFDGKVLLTDLDEDALNTAAEELTENSPTKIQADLSKADQIERIRELIDSNFKKKKLGITCFEVVEHLSDFVPLIRFFIELAESDRATVVLSVPNDAFWAIENPHHQAMWSGSALEEFRSTLPKRHAVFNQYPLHGSCISTPDGNTSAPIADLTSIAPAQGIPSHYLVALGSQIEKLGPVATLVQTDLTDARAWERTREANFAWLNQRVSDLESELGVDDTEIEAPLEPLSHRETENSSVEPEGD